ncbi:MAG: bifunctional riboflavin kinase/FAD synthetase [Gammaproteobacteria bacterium]
MELIRRITDLLPTQRGCVASVGNFDGVHLGHQAVCSELKRVGERLGLATAVIVFEPQPQEYFQPEAAPPRLTRLREKYELLKAQDIDRFVCLRFDQAFAELPAQAFVKQILVSGLGVRSVVAGADFRFGKGREGDYRMLVALGSRYGFSVVQPPVFEIAGERVSSTRVRRALSEGDMSRARRLLGRGYAIRGRIVHGEKRGHAFGFATANIELRRNRSPLRGIFAARVGGIGRTPLPGVAYLGSRPALGGTRDLLEVHIFDFSQDCYGQDVAVEFVAKLRDDRRFESVETLTHQIALDAKQARKLLTKSAPATITSHE